MRYSDGSALVLLFFLFLLLGLRTLGPLAFLVVLCETYGHPALVPFLWLTEPHSPLKGCAVGSPLVYTEVGIMNYACRRNRHTTPDVALALHALLQHSFFYDSVVALTTWALYFSACTHAHEIRFCPTSCFKIFDMRWPQGVSVFCQMVYAPWSSRNG